MVIAVLEFGMFGHELFASRRACRLAGCAFHDPPCRLEINGARGDIKFGDDGIAEGALDLRDITGQNLRFDLGDDDDVLRAELGIVQAEGDAAAIMNRGMTRDNLLDVLWMEILSGDDDQVFLPPDDIEMSIVAETKIAGCVPIGL